MRSSMADDGERGFAEDDSVARASGYATLGVIGFEGKRDYGPLGSVVNRGSRLCDEAAHGQILVDAGIRRQLGEGVRVEDLEPLVLKGFPRPVPAFRIPR